MYSNMNEAGTNTHSYQKSSTENLMEPVMDHRRARYPFCVVWTPLPLLTWIFPFIGHMGIAMSSGVIRDFAGPYFVSEDNMAFGKPTKYWRLRPELASGGASGWDRAVIDASEEYKSRMGLHSTPCALVKIFQSCTGLFYPSDAGPYEKARVNALTYSKLHNLCCDNCHSHVAMALNLMKYDGCEKWNMVKLAFYILLKGHYVSFAGWLKTWMPFNVIVTVGSVIYVFTRNL